jgi:hypothetical protein
MVEKFAASDEGAKLYKLEREFDCSFLPSDQRDLCPIQWMFLNYAAKHHEDDPDDAKQRQQSQTGVGHTPSSTATSTSMNHPPSSGRF